MGTLIKAVTRSLPVGGGWLPWQPDIIISSCRRNGNHASARGEERCGLELGTGGGGGGGAISVLTRLVT